MTAALRRVRGVISVNIDRRRDEAAVLRRENTAPGASLVQAVRRAGYSAALIPTMRIELGVTNMNRPGGPERVRASLLKQRGVRGVHLPSRTQVVVYYDARRVTPRRLMEVIQGGGFRCASSAARG